MSRICKCWKASRGISYVFSGLNIFVSCTQSTVTLVKGKHYIPLPATIPLLSYTTTSLIL